MLGQMMSTRLRRTALAMVTIGILSVFVAVSAGARDKHLSKSELQNLIVNAETKAEHERVAQYFDDEAARYEEEAKDHGELASRFHKNDASMPTKHPGGTQTFQHCDSLSKSLSQAAKDAHALAAEHREMAKQAK
jgi:hypothetical protein